MNYEKNLYLETLEKLLDYNKTFEDIRWIGTYDYFTTWENFVVISDVLYDASYGVQEVMEDLLIVGDDWWLERSEYDGSEWWSFKEIPTKPEKQKLFTTFIDHKWRY
jgi:hypothetical protein